MKKFNRKLTSRSSSRRLNASDIAQSESTGSSLAHVSTTGQAVANVEDTESEPIHSLKQSKVGSIYRADTPQNPESTPAADEPPGQAVSVPIDGNFEGSRPTTTLPCAAMEDNTDSCQNDASLALNSSLLWQKAFEMVKTDDDWSRYLAIIAKNSALQGNNVDSPEGVASVAEKLSDILETSKTTLRLAGRTIVVRDVLNKILDVLASCKDLGTALTSLNPYASTGWKGLQFFVQAAVANKEVAALCWDELPRMVRLMSQYQTFETIYDMSKLRTTKYQLEAALVRLFVAILRYQVVIVKYASSRTDRFKAAFQGKVASMPQRVLDDIKQHEAEVIGMQSLADRETLNIQFQALAESYKANSQELEKGFVELQEANLRAQNLGTITATYLESISEWTEVTRRDAILSWVSTIKYRDAHNNRDKNAMEGTGEWLIQHPEYLHWRSSQQAAVLWLQGLMGSGKSCLAHAVIEDLKLLTSTSMVKKLAYFYCNGSSEEGRKDIGSADNIWRCVLQQLARVGDNSKLMNSIIKIYTDIHLEGHLSEDQCMDLVRDLINKSETTTFVIDGLDECSLEVQKNLMSSIAGLLECCTSPLRIFVSSRHNDNIVDLLQDLPVAEISVGHNNAEDIEKFVKKTAQQAASRPGDRRKYVKSGQSQELAVVERLLEKAGGMFRWVVLAFRFLHASVDFDAMSSRLDELSQLGQLFDLYDKIYDDMMSRVDAADQARIKTLLTFMLHGRQYIGWSNLNVISGYPSEIVRIAEILEACEFSATPNLENMPMSVGRVRTLCPDLVVITLKQWCGEYDLAFPHVSVREWLLASAKYSGIFARHPGNVYLSQLCMKVISASGTQPVVCIDKGRNQNSSSDRKARGNALMRYSSSNLLHHLSVLVPQQNFSYPSGKIWSEDNLLRALLKDFLFNLNQRESELPDRLATGFQLWHRLLRRQRQVRIYFPKGILMTRMYIRLENFVPVIICGHLGYYCDLSRVPEAAMEVAATRLDWPVQSLAAVVSVCDSEAIKWLVEQLHPSPEVLTQALLQYVSSCIWCRDYFLLRIEIRQSRAEIFCRIRLLVASGIDVNGRYGSSETPLIELLLAAWLDSKRARASGKYVMATIMACLCELGLDIRVPIHISSKAELHKSDQEFFSSCAHLQTLFDWLLYWDAVSEVPTVEALFFAQQWSKSVWTRWLILAVNEPNCSPNLVQSCLEHGADPKISDEAGSTLLQVARRRGCSEQVLALLRAASFAADIWSNLRTKAIVL